MDAEQSQWLQVMEREHQASLRQREAATRVGQTPERKPGGLLQTAYTTAIGKLSSCRPEQNQR